MQSFGTKSKTAFTGVTSSVAGMALGGLGAVTAVAALGTALVDASKAAMEDEESQKLLETAMRNNLDATDEQVASMETWIDKTAPGGGGRRRRAAPRVEQPDHRRSGRGDRAGDDGCGVGYRRRQGLDVETVTKAMAKAYGGNMGSLSRLGIQIKDADGKTVSFEEAMDNAAETMGGSATAAALTLEGQLRRTKMAVDEAKESIGGLVNTGLANLITGAEGMGLSLALATADLDTTEASANALQPGGGEPRPLGDRPDGGERRPARHLDGVPRQRRPVEHGDVQRAHQRDQTDHRGHPRRDGRHRRLRRGDSGHHRRCERDQRRTGQLPDDR